MRKQTAKKTALKVTVIPDAWLTPRQLPAMIDLQVALPSGKTVTLANCTVTWSYNKEQGSYIPVHTRETALRIDKLAKENPA